MGRIKNYPLELYGELKIRLRVPKELLPNLYKGISYKADEEIKNFFKDGIQVLDIKSDLFWKEL